MPLYRLVGLSENCRSTEYAAAPFYGITLRYPDESVSTAMDLFRQPRHGLSGNKWYLFVFMPADHIAEAECG